MPPGGKSLDVVHHALARQFKCVFAASRSFAKYEDKQKTSKIFAEVIVQSASDFTSHHQYLNVPI